MTRQKPSLERYYRNTKTGQYASLKGSPLAIRNIETYQWPKFQKITVKRISKREFEANKPEIILGYGMEYDPVRIKTGKKGNSIHQVDFAYFPN